MEVLRVGIDGDKIHSAHLRVNHVVDGVLSRASDTNDPNPCERLYVWVYLRHK